MLVFTQRLSSVFFLFLTFIFQSSLSWALTCDQAFHAKSTSDSREIVISVPEKQNQQSKALVVNTGAIELSNMNYTDPSFLGVYFAAYPESVDAIKGFVANRSGLLFSSYFYQSLVNFLKQKDAPTDEEWSEELLTTLTQDFQELIFQEFSVRSTRVESVAAESQAKSIRERLGRNSFSYSGRTYTKHRNSLIQLLKQPLGDSVFKALVFHSLSYFQAPYKIGNINEENLEKYKAQFNAFENWIESDPWNDDEAIFFSTLFTWVVGGIGAGVAVGTGTIPLWLGIYLGATAPSIWKKHPFQKPYLHGAKWTKYLTQVSFEKFLANPVRWTRNHMRKRGLAKQYRKLINESTSNKEPIYLETDADTKQIESLPEADPISSSEVLEIPSELGENPQIGEIAELGAPFLKLSLRFDLITMSHLQRSALVADELFRYIMTFDKDKTPQVSPGQVSALIEALSNREPRILESLTVLSRSLDIAALIKDKIENIKRTLKAAKKSANSAGKTSINAQIELLDSHIDFLDTRTKNIEENVDKLNKQLVIITKSVFKLRSTSDHVDGETAEMLAQLKEIILSVITEKK